MNDTTKKPDGDLPTLTEVIVPATESASAYHDALHAWAERIDNNAATSPSVRRHPITGQITGFRETELTQRGLATRRRMGTTDAELLARENLRSIKRGSTHDGDTISDSSTLGR